MEGLLCLCHISKVGSPTLSSPWTFLSVYILLCDFWLVNKLEKDLGLHAQAWAKMSCFSVNPPICFLCVHDMGLWSFLFPNFFLQILNCEFEKGYQKTMIFSRFIFDWVSKLFWLFLSALTHSIISTNSYLISFVVN